MKKFLVEIELTLDILILYFICYYSKTDFSIFLIFYEKFKKDALFIFKSLADKKIINISEKKFLFVIDFCKKYYKHIKNNDICEFNKTELKMKKYFEQNTKIVDNKLICYFDERDMYGI